MNLSIIIPVYNVEKYLPQCLDSVFSQNLKNCEVICVNDGSLDGSRKILEDYQKKYSNMVIVDRENGGLSAARNSGLQIAQGEYIYFLDSDDYLLPGSLEKMIGFAKDNKLELSLFNGIQSTGKLYYSSREKIDQFISGLDFYEKFFSINRFFPPSVQWLYLYKKKLIVRFDTFFPENNLQEDEPYTVKSFFHAKKVGCLNDSIIYHRVLRPGSITQTSNLPHLVDAKEAWQKLYEYLKNNGCTTKTFYRKIFYLYQNTLSKIQSKKFKKNNDNFLSAEDFSIMRRCAVDSELYKIYWYYRKGNRFYKWYSKGVKYSFLKKILNKIIVINYNLISHE